jgi:hypothetical protein
MSIQYANVLVPPPVTIPRGAVWAPALVNWLVRAGRAAWREMEAAGQARANGALQQLAVRYAHQPELAQSLRDAMHRSAMHRDSQH